MRELDMVNGRVTDADEDERLPVCPSCNAYAVPTNEGECGDCGTAVEYRGPTTDGS